MGQESHRNAQVTISESVVGNITLTQTPAEVKAGATALKGRIKVFIINDSSELIYLNESPTFTINDANLSVFSGESFYFDVEPNPESQVPFKMYAIIEEGTNTAKVLEVK